MRRYFAYYGPARLRAAAHFFGASQRALTPLLPDLPLREETWRGETCGAGRFLPGCSPVPGHRRPGGPAPGGL